MQPLCFQGISNTALSELQLWEVYCGSICCYSKDQRSTGFPCLYSVLLHLKLINQHDELAFSTLESPSGSKLLEGVFKCILLCSNDVNRQQVIESDNSVFLYFLIGKVFKWLIDLFMHAVIQLVLAYICCDKSNEVWIKTLLQSF